MLFLLTRLRIRMDPDFLPYPEIFTGSGSGPDLPDRMIRFLLISIILQLISKRLTKLLSLLGTGTIYIIYLFSNLFLF
jgi:hypothetical protein